jgi:hypothetical protein
VNGTRLAAEAVGEFRQHDQRPFGYTETGRRKRHLTTETARKIGSDILAKTNKNYVRFEVITVVTMKNGVFWVVTPRGSCKNRRFGGTLSLHLQGDKTFLVQLFLSP